MQPNINSFCLHFNCRPTFNLRLSRFYIEFIRSRFHKAEHRGVFGETLFEAKFVPIKLLCFGQSSLNVHLKNFPRIFAFKVTKCVQKGYASKLSE